MGPSSGCDEESLETLIHVFHRMHLGCMRHELEKRGVQEASNPPVLFALHRSAIEQMPMTQRSIAKHLGVAPPSVAVSIKRMERAGLVCKQTDPLDQRKKTITLTDKGLALMEKCLEARQEIYHKLIDGFSPQEIATLQDFYRRMICSLSQCTPHPPGMIPLSDLEE